MRYSLTSASPTCDLCLPIHGTRMDWNVVSRKGQGRKSEKASKQVAEPSGDGGHAPFRHDALH